MNQTARKHIAKAIKEIDAALWGIPPQDQNTPRQARARLISIIFADGYELTTDYRVNNLAVERLALGWAKHDDATKNRNLSWLVYYAQEFVGNDWLIENGYSPLTDEMVQAAFERKAKIEIYGESIFGNSKTAFNVREINGKLWVMKPKARNRAIYINRQPAKIVRG